MSSGAERVDIWSLTAYFLKLGAIGFGGPAALAGFMHRDLVERRSWVSEDEYALGLALAQIMPGPLAAQLAIALGYFLHGVPGATLVGLAFVLPSFAMVVLISMAGALDVSLFGFLFGSILTTTRTDLALVATLGVAGLGTIALLYRALVAVALDEEGARVAGVPVAFLNVVLAVLAATTVAVSMRIVGILLIAALMVLPVIAATRIARSMRSTLLLGMAIGLGSVLGGLTVAYYADLPPGGTIVLIAAATFLVASGVSMLRRG